MGYTPPDSPLSIPGSLPRTKALCVGYRPPESPLSIPGSLPRIRVLCVGYRPPVSPLSIADSSPRMRAICVGYAIHIPPPSFCLLLILASKLVFMDSSYSPTAPRSLQQAPGDQAGFLAALILTSPLQGPCPPAGPVHPLLSMPPLAIHK